MLHSTLRLLRSLLCWSTIGLAASLLLLALGCGPSASGDNKKGDGGSSDDAIALDGQIQPDGSKTDAGIEGCDPQNFVLVQDPPPEVFLVVDRSGSMLDEGSTAGMTKWDELVSAVEIVTQQFESQIQFGLLMYPSGSECSTSGPQVQVSLYNRLAISHFLGEANPAGGTPTAAALTNAAHALDDLGQTGSQRFLILATDGGPNCNYFLNANPTCSCNLTDQAYCCTNHPAGVCYLGQYCLDDTGAVTVILDLQALGVDTFVIGLAGTSQYAETLDGMAVAGGRPQAGPPSYYEASDQAALTAALTDIAGSVISCRIDLAQPPDLPDYVRIYMDGSEIPRDQDNGWTYTDSSHTAIEFMGAACDALKDGQEHDIIATFACTVD